MSALDDAALRQALELEATERWPLERLLILCREWIAGTQTAGLGTAVKGTKHAALGKVHRLIDAGILANRPSPLPVAGETRTIRPQPLPPGARTLPPLASERTELQP